MSQNLIFKFPTNKLGKMEVSGLSENLITSFRIKSKYRRYDIIYHKDFSFDICYTFLCEEITSLVLGQAESTNMISIPMFRKLIKNIQNSIRKNCAEIIVITADNRKLTLTSVNYTISANIITLAIGVKNETEN